MKVSTPFKFALSAITLAVSGSTLSIALSPAQIQQLEGADADVIVIMRDQLPNTPPVRGGMVARASALASAQAPILTELRQAKAQRIKQFSMINAVATRVSKAEVARLSAHPLVKAVVPDLPIKVPARTKNTLQTESVSFSGFKRILSNAGSGGGSNGGLCNTLEPEALQLTNTAFSNPSTPQAQTVRDGNGKLVTGQGVKVAWIADGLDPTVAGFTRPDGTPVFIDYQDFSGDPAGTPTPGGEAFGDASSIAAQDNPNGVPLLFDISQYVSPAHPLPSGCNIRIRGMAPGASLVGLKVFSSLGFTNTSTFVQAIEYAVNTAQVDVINQSFGGAPFPDNDNDPISLADAAAIRAGITVVVSTGDAGTAGTLGSPSTDPDVISVGASNQYRVYAQTGSGIMPLINGGYLNNNISPFSSGGFAQVKARTVDVVAPGDTGWALCSPNADLYTDCTNLAGGATAFQNFGGTSESAPLTAGEAALVIQAYRSTHRGADPSPALVKQIIMSTATDLGAPSSEQGAGLINSLAAVQAALSVRDFNGRPGGHGQGILASPSAGNTTDQPRSVQLRFFTITNTGTSTQHLSPSLQALGSNVAGATLNLTLNPANLPTFPNITGAPRAYMTQTFKVPANAQHLDAAIAFKTPSSTSATPIVYFALVDPNGRQANYSVPQGFGSGYGHVDVVSPMAGTWTAYIWTRPPGVAGSYTGPLQFTWAAERYATFGSVFPSRVDLAPGASTVLTAYFQMPSQPGDVAAALRFTDSSGAAHPAIPLTLRTLVPVSRNGGSFTGTLTGGNARPGTGPTQTFEFNVPNGVQNIGMNLQVSDPGYLLEGLLVDPNGMQMSVAPNLTPSGSAQLGALQMFHYNAQPGRWKFVLLQNFTSSGNQTSLPFNAQISFFGNGQVASGSLPNSAGAVLSASGGPVTIPIQVTNTGIVPQWFFADARLSTPTVVQLPTGQASASQTLQGAAQYVWLPPEVSGVGFQAQAAAPLTMDVYNDVGFNVGATGSPDLWAKPVGTNTVAAYLFKPEIPWGPWILAPSLVGPYGASGASTDVPFATSVVALMQPFDGTVAADSGNVWADLTTGSQTFNPLALAPGASGTINVTITPDPTQVGKTVSGYLYIDTFNAVVNSGDEVVRIPYSYTVGQ